MLNFLCYNLAFLLFLSLSQDAFHIQPCVALSWMSLHSHRNHMTILQYGLEYVLHRQRSPFVFMWGSHYCQLGSASCFMVQVRPVTLDAEVRAHRHYRQILLTKPETRFAHNIHSGWVKRSLMCAQFIFSLVCVPTGKRADATRNARHCLQNEWENLSHIQTDMMMWIQSHLLTQIPTLTRQMWTAAKSLPLDNDCILLPSALCSCLSYCFQMKRKKCQAAGWAHSNLTHKEENNEKGVEGVNKKGDYWERNVPKQKSTSVITGVTDVLCFAVKKNT